MDIEKYKKDLSRLIKDGSLLHAAIQRECYEDKFDELYKKELGDKFDDYIKMLPIFRNKYQHWYSEALVLIRQTLPDRLNDFVKLYEKPKNRKTIEYGSYVIEDYLQALVVTSPFGERKVGPEAAIAQFEQQLNILKSLSNRFESTLFDIKQLVQADVFDNEIEVSEELLKKGFVRAAGAIAGVVLEGHLKIVCENHKIKIVKKNPSISDYNDLLKKDGIIEAPEWRKIQYLGDIRNTCDHKKKVDPKNEDIEELIGGVRKITKNLF